MLRCPGAITTIADAKKWLISTAITLKSCKCPVCGQTAKLYPRKLSSAMARFLVDIYSLTSKQRPEMRWVNISKDMIDRASKHVSHDYSKLRFWGLLEPSPKDSAMWRITEAGIAFVEGRMVAPHTAYVYNNSCVKLSEKTITIKEALGSKFDLKEMMDRKDI